RGIPRTAIVRRFSLGMSVLLLAVSVSYWYCLPVMTQSLFSYNELRGYDFLLGILILVLLGRYRKELSLFFKQDLPGRWLLRFSLWATATFPVTVGICIARENY